VPTPNSQSETQQLHLRREIVRLKRELAGTSAQDDFAKWAKLRRQHDKAVADYDKISTLSNQIHFSLLCAILANLYTRTANALSSTRSTFDSRINTVRTVTLTGFRLWLQYWYMREALFWIPQGWLPGYVEWVLSFPKAPRGSVSVQIWSMACSTVVAMASEVFVALAVLTTRGAEVGKKPVGEKKAQ
jgi:tail-anchored protein insertion receptor